MFKKILITLLLVASVQSGNIKCGGLPPLEETVYGVVTLTGVIGIFLGIQVSNKHKKKQEYYKVKSIYFYNEFGKKSNKALGIGGLCGFATVCALLKLATS